MLRIERCAAVALLLIAVACNQPAREAKKLVKAAVPVPQMHATVVTIHTTMQPGNQSTTSTIVIGPDVARDANEIGTWRLFDVKNARVAFVNDGEKTFRWESLQSLQQRRAAAPLRAGGAPRPQFALTPVTRPILDVPATQAVVKLGAYQREVWFGSHPLIPAALFPLIEASSGSNDSVTAATHGFPLAEHAEVPYGKTKLVIDRQVVSVERKNVPQALLQIPSTYKAATEPAARRPAVSSRPLDRRTPAAGSQSSATTRTSS